MPSVMLSTLEIAVRNQNPSKGTSPQLVAIALMHRLHIICVQLFLTILHVMEHHNQQPASSTSSGSESSSGSSTPIGGTRRSRKGPSIAEIEAKLLRHVTSPLLTNVRPAEPRRSRRGHPASRPPSPQLFAISEED